MSEEIIFPQPFNHEAKNIWEACGFDAQVMNDKLNAWTVALNANKTPSKMVEFIESLEVSTREKITLSYYVCGILSSQHFDCVVKEMTAITAQQINSYRQEIKRLGGTSNPLDFGKKQPLKKNRIKK